MREPFANYNLANCAREVVFGRYFTSAIVHAPLFFLSVRVMSLFGLDMGLPFLGVIVSEIWPVAIAFRPSDAISSVSTLRLIRIELLSWIDRSIPFLSFSGRGQIFQRAAASRFLKASS